MWRRAYRWLREMEWWVSLSAYITEHLGPLAVGMSGTLAILHAWLVAAWPLLGILAVAMVSSIVSAVAVVAVQRWSKGINASRLAPLITRLEALGDLFEDEMKGGKPPSTRLARRTIQVARDLQALGIPHPNFHSLSVWPILAWLPFVDTLLPALRRNDMKAARDAVNRIDMAVGLRPRV